MSDFSLTKLFVLPTTVTLPTTGGPQDLTPNQFGIFNQSYVAVTSGTVAASKYIYLAQGRIAGLEPNLGSKRSDKIYADSILEWYKAPATTGFSNQITQLSAFQAKCDQQVTVTLRLFSDYTAIGFYNGMTRSITVTTPCCDCGSDPCETLTDQQIQDLVDEFVVGFNTDRLMKNLILAERIGTGASSILRITGKALPTPQPRQNPNVNRQHFDRLYFFAYAYVGGETSQDPELYFDTCEPFATPTVTQRATWPKGSSAEIKELEKQYFSYDTNFKNLFGDSDWNNTFQSQVVDGTFYDFYYLKFKQKQQNVSWQDEQHIDEAVILAIPTGQSSATETILTAFLGAPVNEGSANITTTSTTSTTSSSTTTSTTLTP